MSALASRLGGYVQAYTLYSSVRPFGISAIVGGWDSEAEMPVDGQVGEGPKTGAGGKASFDEQDVRRGGPALYMIEPSGLYWVSYIDDGFVHFRKLTRVPGLLRCSNRQRSTVCQRRTRKTRPRLAYLSPYLETSCYGSCTHHLRGP
jgi:hypothetical protein